MAGEIVRAFFIIVGISVLIAFVLDIWVTLTEDGYR